MTDTDKELIKTPFHKYHIEAGAKMVPFAGYHMPVQYKGITVEHLAVRDNVGLFDLSHMGEIVVKGKERLEFLQHMTTNNVAALKPGEIQYTCMPEPDGGIVDDLLVYCAEDRYLLVVNASNIEKDFEWLDSHADNEVDLNNISEDVGLLAVQGPNAQKVIQPLTSHDLENMKFYTWAQADIAGKQIMFSRTGYTGEDGFEFYIPKDSADQLWGAITGEGAKHQMELIGLGARDTLRLEMKMALYGNDIDETTTPIEAGLSWIVDFEKEFIAKDVLLKQKKEKPSRRLVCLEVEGRAFPRQGYDVLIDGKVCGKITSGTVSPSLKKPIAMAYVPRSHAKSGSEVQIDIRGRQFTAKVVKPPFYKEASHR